VIFKNVWSPNKLHSAVDINFGQTKSDSIKLMITISDDIYLLYSNKLNLQIWLHYAAENINQGSQ